MIDVPVTGRLYRFERPLSSRQAVSASTRPACRVLGRG
jgi:hypothetical protein